jgi:hypothetical protein
MALLKSSAQIRMERVIVDPRQSIINFFIDIPGVGISDYV